MLIHRGRRYHSVEKYRITRQTARVYWLCGLVIAREIARLDIVLPLSRGLLDQ